MADRAPAALALLLVLVAVDAYPVFGTKRYGRSNTPLPGAWGLSSVMHLPSYYYQALPRPQTHYPLSYYEALAPYAADYTDDYYYPQETPLSYPLYYPTLTRAASKYDLYQHPLPLYYPERHLPHPGYTYYESGDPVDDLQDEILQEEEREEREEALPIGQETWYETDDTGTTTGDESFDDVNAAFLQNLMMYNSALSNPYGKPPIDQQDYSDEYWRAESLTKYPGEDEDVKELKMLAGKPKKQKSKNSKKHTAEERLQIFEQVANSNSKTKANKNNAANDNQSWMNWNSKRTYKYGMDPIANLALKKQEHSMHGAGLYGLKELSFSDRKSSTTSSTQAPVVVSTHGPEEVPRDARGGQKEVVLMRPATPVRRPFSEPVMELLAQQGGPERKRAPSVYDTIKHLLEMEKSLEEKYEQQPLGPQSIRPAMRKRYVSNEESLVEQLAGLKKTAVRYQDLLKKTSTTAQDFLHDFMKLTGIN